MTLNAVVSMKIGLNSQHEVSLDFIFRKHESCSYAEYDFAGHNPAYENIDKF